MIQPLELNDLITEAKRSSGKLIDPPRTFNSDSEMQSFYQRFGYVTIKSLIPKSLIDCIQRDLHEIFFPFATDKENPIDSAISHLDQTDKPKLFELHVAASKALSFKAISAFLDKVLRKASGNSAPVLEIASGFLLGIPSDKRLVYDFHQESNYMKGFEDIFNVHYPLLRPSTLENGTMSILPGSHRYGTLAYEKRRISNDSYTDLIPTNIESIAKELPELHCYLELGDCVIFHKDLIHRSNFNRTQLCRPVGVSRFTQSLKGDWANRRPDEL